MCDEYEMVPLLVRTEDIELQQASSVVPEPLNALPRSDPRSFYQQANVHCAYCSGALRQPGRPELPLQIHFTWLFFPFHRAYLYFFERIAAKLLGDPGFALPFWSWDVPEGMRIPDEFADPASPLYDTRRNLRPQQCGRQRFLTWSSWKWRTITPTSRRLNTTSGSCTNRYTC
ncbi:hypothetical protein PR202_ga09511 [Eleusine coracana subsp. coracana]|uniref:Tyrosinase copper-binding domain-containing protein n=1 Tax=Eleusine coracana subsp. coracana TaxID=191504 RepID=A0AAV5C374_ELECO|nr:hypothetical protein PR202_ga09511 [Eleusine coracana subsp. coracana]